LDYKNASGILSEQVHASTGAPFKKTEKRATAAGIDLDQ
jgi:hypothetical protein